ncbi:MAG: hypothetical protein A3C50_00085 [Candidatus Staskawiczbacteria bacterium RIFCSPHIGHO2_02_FULL_43_16]|uniref:Uncharacterized protein n=1 Tax=Candidatus Staskawiczbacteria bacterium RIFCSPHIGHO2_01_FULL_41_41 TaxID=1802203 RepID=A0A1G2HW37_9BACT|nr:MAG: hypothetical protein A2822_01750 [Candidatus Staskawiczbacteria bacterium RIFCSPHIGHO2_01_FULL_41_41]OGZ68896.1 MAG: hypothetical protein A3C50_00085 [Candidatus Staskawiczbacteria bacterium RIFCSPHIGHO2_02_FULL_43_16]OGZ74922.1 MAG: hypothetical protein A3A12_03730 [Candidatus Staskawiczbacteria bacterium RIFCSPLOWO2_01_FULL_43_17b]
MAEFNPEVIDARRRKVKMLLPAVVLATSLYYSMLFTVGIVAGYVLCKVFCHLFVHKSKIDSVFLDLGKWKLHLHHWILGMMILGTVWLIDYLYLPTFFAGAVCGMILQDIYDYNDWHQVLVKNDEHQAN